MPDQQVAQNNIRAIEDRIRTAHDYAEDFAIGAHNAFDPKEKKQELVAEGIWRKKVKKLIKQYTKLVDKFEKDFGVKPINKIASFKRGSFIS